LATLDEKRAVVDRSQAGLGPGIEGLGLRPDANSVFELSSIWRLVPLRHARHPAARLAATLFLIPRFPPPRNAIKIRRYGTRHSVRSFAGAMIAELNANLGRIKFWKG
jgi:hypothetical protein